jgi:hypothetical protein
MLKMSGFDVLFAAAGDLYLLLALVSICAALWFGKTWTRKLVYAVLVLALFIAPITPEIYRTVEFRSRFAKAQALFEERCKTAGEKVYKTVENVEGVLLTNIRPKAVSSEYANPNWPDAALPYEAHGNGYVMTFLLWEQHQDKRNPRGYLNTSPSELPGYRYVDVREPDGLINRYRLALPEMRDLSHEPVKDKPARYAISFTNMTEAADRQLWIAGTKLLVTDTVTGEAIAEKTVFSMEPGQGNAAGFRSPWAFAQSCPSLAGMSGSATRFFVDQVLKPKQGN